MGLTAGTLWEIRSGGDDLNGAGFYDRNPGVSVDYTQQDAAQLSLSDLATPGAGSTTLTSATGGFTAAMAGNIIYIASGTNFTAGYYEITAYTDTNTVTLDRTPSAAGAGSSGAGKVGGGRATILDSFFEQSSAGDHFYLEVGTYSLGANINVSKDGNNASFITFEGYNTTRGDNPVEDNRPFIDAVTYDWRLGDYWWTKNIRFKTVDSTGIRFGSYNRIKNCKAVSKYAFAAGYALNVGLHSIAEDCEAINPKGIAIYLSNNSSIIKCYAHDSYNGVKCAVSARVIAECVIADCFNQGVELSTGNGIIIEHCTMDHCKEGIGGTTGARNTFRNNQITNNDDGIKYTSANAQFLSYNNFHNNSTDATNVTKGPNTTANAPSYSDIDTITGTTATTSSGVLTDSAADFTPITDGKHWCEIQSGTGVTPGMYEITAHNVGADTITLDPDPGDSAAGDINYQIRIDNNYESGATASGRGMSEMMAEIQF